LYLRPLAVHDAEHRGVARHAAVAGLVAAQDSLERAADPQHRVPRALVARVGLELDAPAAPDLEGMAQHQELGLGVDVTALERAPDPRPADLDPPVRVIDGSEAGRARDLAAGDVDRRERKR